MRSWIYGIYPNDLASASRPRVASERDFSVHDTNLTAISRFANCGNHWELFYSESFSEIHGIPIYARTEPCRMSSEIGFESFRSETQTWHLNRRMKKVSLKRLPSEGLEQRERERQPKTSALQDTRLCNRSAASVSSIRRRKEQSCPTISRYGLQLHRER